MIFEIWKKSGHKDEPTQFNKPEPGEIIIYPVNQRNKMSNITLADKNPSLYEIATDVQHAMTLAETIFADEGEIPADLETQMSSLMISQEKKVDSVCYYLDRKQAEIDVIEAEIQRAKTWIARQQKSIDWLLNVAGKIMTEQNVKSLNGTTMRKLITRVSTQTVVNVDPSELPNEFKRTEIKVSADKTAIKAAISQGFSIPGCETKEVKNFSWK
jgi:hypothetical protein